MPKMHDIPRYLLKRMIAKDGVRLTDDESMIEIQFKNILRAINTSLFSSDFMRLIEPRVDGEIIAEAGDEDFFSKVKVKIKDNTVPFIELGSAGMILINEIISILIPNIKELTKIVAKLGTGLPNIIAVLFINRV